MADSVNDAPILSPVPNITAPNGTAKVTLLGTDLQLDLLRYGAQPVLPVVGAAVTGTSPTVAIPLVSNTDNIIAALALITGTPPRAATTRGPSTSARATSRCAAR